LNHGTTSNDSNNSLHVIWQSDETEVKEKKKQDIIMEKAYSL
jgi:hypothetical protein